MSKERPFELPPEHKLDKIVSLTQAESISGLSVETWKRVHPDKLIQLSPRRIGVRLRDALMLWRQPSKEAPMDP
jgi:hypothetical protein